jgi:O-antigen ligase
MVSPENRGKRAAVRSDRPIIRHSERALTALLAVLLLAAPLPFGSVTPGAAAMVRVLCFVAFALAMAAADDPRALRPAWGPAAALAAIALFGCAQALPWPAFLVGWISPEHLRLEHQAAAVLADGPPVASGLSLAAAASRTAALTWAAAAACLAAAAVAGRVRGQRRVLAAALVAGGLFQVVFGARGWSTRATTIWGVQVPGSAARLRGTFVNANHLALFLELALPVVFAAGWWGARRARSEISAERRVALLGLPWLLWLVLFLGLSFSGSRAGMVAGLVAVAAQGGLLAATRRGSAWRVAPAGLAAALIGLGVVAVVGLQEGLGRMLTTSPNEVSWVARRQAYGATLALWRRFPATGVGLGTFREAFPLVQPAALRGIWWHAHNDLLELAATTGLPGLALAAAGLWLLLRRLQAVLLDGSRSEDRAAALAALGAFTAVAVHELFDFGLTIPANAGALAVLLGAALGAKVRPPAPAGTE